ncbi:MAG TPA: alpha/beta hydrolase [Kofleriaceae bacterium]|nr:alpha/beta hydrolase [Kofleriaceae bacterium]
MSPKLLHVALVAVLALISCHRSDPKTERMVDGPAGGLYVRDTLAGSVPVVFVHAFAGSGADWSKQVEHLRATHRVITIDLRGHGKSAAPADNDYRVESLAADIAAAVDALDLDQFVLVGHSMGGSAAAEYVRQHPERVSALMLVGTPGKSPPQMAQQVMTALRGNFTVVSEGYWDRMLANADRKVERHLRKEMREMPKDRALAIIGAVFAYDPLPALRAYRGPILLVDTTASDGPGSLHAQARQIPRIVIEGTSHWPHLDKPEYFNGILDGFLQTARARNLSAE